MELESVPGSWLTTVTPSVTSDVTGLVSDVIGGANDSSAENATAADGGGTFYSVTQSVLLVLVASVLVSVTVVGNIMVMVSFHIDKQLQTISNYFLFSLAVADFAIGLISMPLFTVYQVMGRWVMGPIVCDTWLALDYLASNASVLNLLIISFDRYFSVTRPLTYRARRTNRRAAAMIACAWGVSLVLWPPWIYAWPYIEGKRTVEPHECYIQFLQTNHYWTFGTAIAAFYLPVLIMCGLYYRIWLETEQRQRDLSHLQAGKNSSRRSNASRGEETGSESHRSRLDHGSSARDDSLRNNTILPAHCAKGGGSWRRLSAWCSGSSDRPRPHSALDLPLAPRNTPNGRHQSLRQSRSAVYTTPTYMCTYGRHTIPSPLPILSGLRRNASAGTLGASRSLSAESVYTIVIKFPEPVTPSADPSITMLSDSDAEGDEEGGHQPHCPLSRSPASVAARRPAPAAARDEDSDSSDGELPLPPPPPTTRRPSQLPDLRIPLNARVIPKQLAKGPTPKKKKKREEKKQERKAAKTLSAILLAFIITWTPYNVLVLIRVMLKCDDCIPAELWNFSYYLCYINSTVNPLCYALCNASFRRTYVKILTCTWSKNKRHPASRVYYN